MELERKHLIPYLDYSLRGIITIGGPAEKEVMLCSLNISRIMAIEVADDEHAPRFPADLDQFKPFLHPLSKLEKKETEGEIKMCQELDEAQWDIRGMRYDSVQELIAEHYDVYDLIDYNLAIKKKL